MGRVGGFVEAGDGEGSAGGVVDGECGAEDGGSGVGVGDVEGCGFGGGHELEDAVGVAAEDGVLGPGHAEVGEVGGGGQGRGPVGSAGAGEVGGEDAGVGGGDVGVGAEDGGGAAGAVPAHGDFFGGGFGVDLDEGDRAVGELVEEAVDTGEGVVCLEGVHEESAEDGDDVDGRQAGRFDGHRAPAWGGVGEVGGPDEVGGFFEGAEDLFFAEGVVAEGHGVDAGVLEFAEQFGGQARAVGGVFGVGDDEVGLEAFAELGQALPGREEAWGADDVTEEEEVHVGGGSWVAGGSL